MARNMYGATSADFTLTAAGRVVPGATLTVWTARTGGTQVTDLLDVTSVACTTVTSGADGSVVFYGPNNEKATLWLDSGQGSRIAVRPVDITGETGATPALTIGTVDTGTAAASITGTDEEPVLNLTIPPAANDSITSAMIAADAVGTSEIAANAVGSSELADNAVDTAAVADSAITTAKVADGAVTAAKMQRQVGNLLSENQASIETDTSGWAAGTGSPTLARSSTQAKSGTYSLSVTATANATLTFAMGAGTANYAPVTAGETYTASLEMYAATTSRNAFVSVVWYTSGGSSVSTADAGTTTLPLNTWTRLTLTAVAPATAAFARIIVTVNSAATSDVFYMDCAGVWRGASGKWQPPGVPIPGQSPIAVNGAVHLSGTGSPEGVVTAAPGSTWLQTDSTTDVKGWIKWVKATGTGNTGWVAGPEADTGWRNVSAALTPANATINYAYTRRIGNQAYWAFSITATAKSAIAKLQDGTVPAGFVPVPVAGVNGDQYAINTEGAATAALLLQGSQIGVYSTSAAQIPAGSTWRINTASLTTNTWPSSLPGSAA